MAGFSNSSNLIKGTIAILISTLSFTLMSLCLKLTGDHVPLFEKAIFRNVIAMLISAYFVYRSGNKFLGHRQNLGKLLLRSGFGLIGVLLNIYAVEKLVLSDADMIGKISPFILLVLSWLILKENLSKRIITICIIAFIGILFIIKPSFNSDFIPYLGGLLGAAGGACAYLMLRILALSPQKESPNTIVFFFSFVSTIVLIPMTAMNYVPLTTTEFWYLMGSGIFATFGQFGITMAYQYANAKEISIYTYSSVFFAAMLGFIYFQELPDKYSIIGYILIFISGIWNYQINRKSIKKQ